MNIDERPSRSRRSVRILFGSRVVSISGNLAAGIALSVAIYTKTQSGWWLAFFFLGTFGLSGFMSPIAGAIGDRFDRRVVMITCELTGAALLTVLLFVHRPIYVVVLSSLVAIANLPLWSSISAVVPNLAGEDNLQWGNSLIQMSFSIGSIVGPLAGGALVAVFGPSSVLMFDIVTFLGSAVLIATIKGNFGGGKESSEEHPGVLAGYRFVLRDGTLRLLALAWAVVAFALDVALVADLPLVHELHGGSFEYGLLVTAWACGAILGALLARRLSPDTEARAIVIGVGGVAIGYALIAISPLYAMVFAIMIATAVCDSLGSVAGNSFIQRRTPDAVRSRVFAAVTSMWLMANVIAFPTAGWVLSVWGPRAVYVMGAAVAVAATIIILPLLRRATSGSEPSRTP